jgi:hypothetical protein
LPSRSATRAKIGVKTAYKYPIHSHMLISVYACIVLPMKTRQSIVRIANRDSNLTPSAI